MRPSPFQLLPQLPQLQQRDGESYDREHPATKM